jgi:hypothetical protein
MAPLSRFLQARFSAALLRSLALALGSLVLLAGIANSTRAYAESVALVCESTSTYPECNTFHSNTPCYGGLRSVVLNVDFALGRVEFTDPRTSVTWMATGAKVSDTVVDWDKLAPWPKNPALQSRFYGSLNRLTGEVEFTYSYDQGPGSTWAPSGFPGKCRRATKKF